ncbi:MAG: hypothetical protein ACLQL2_02545 [Methylovirgula sp.]
MRARIFCAAAMTLAASYAFADAGGTTVSLSPLMTYFGPLIGAALAALAAALLRTIFAILNVYLKKLGFAFTTDQYAAVARSAEKIVAGWWSSVEPAVAAAKYDVRSEIVAHLAQAVLDDIGPIAKDLGLTPQGAAQFVVARIGDLQKDLLKALGATPNPPQAAVKTQ